MKVWTDLSSLQPRKKMLKHVLPTLCGLILAALTSPALSHFLIFNFYTSKMCCIGCSACAPAPWYCKLIIPLSPLKFKQKTAKKVKLFVILRFLKSCAPARGRQCSNFALFVLPSTRCGWEFPPLNLLPQRRLPAEQTLLAQSQRLNRKPQAA